MKYDKARLLKLVRQEAVQWGDFTLASGQKSKFYIDCRKVTLLSAGAALIGAGILETAGGWDFQAVGGLTLGADPIIGAVLTLAGLHDRPLRGAIVRKAAKDHGTGRRVEGPLQKNDRVLVVEDVATTGSSIVQACQALEQEGAVIAGIMTVLDRQAGAEVVFAQHGYRFASLLTLSDLALSAPGG